jgi:hypothetical protein
MTLEELIQQRKNDLTSIEDQISRVVKLHERKKILITEIETLLEAQDTLRGVSKEEPKIKIMGEVGDWTAVKIDWKEGKLENNAEQPELPGIQETKEPDVYDPSTPILSHRIRRGQHGNILRIIRDSQRKNVSSTYITDVANKKGLKLHKGSVNCALRTSAEMGLLKRVSLGIYTRTDTFEKIINQL